VLGEGAPSPQFLGLYQHEARKERLGTIIPLFLFSNKKGSNKKVEHVY